MELYINTPQYTIGREAVTTLEQVYQQRRVEVRVHGYWSDVITIYVSRDYNWRVERDGGPDHTWDIKLTNSSGGRDEKVVADSLEAEENFGHALIAAAAYARALREREPELEAIYQAERAEEKARDEAEKAAKQARIDADPAVGERVATATLNRLAATMELTSRDQHISVTPRGWREEDGDRNRDTIAITDTRSGAVRFKLNHRAVSRKEAIAALAAASARSIPTIQE